MDVKEPVQPVDFSVEKILATGEYLLLNRQCVKKLMVPSEDQDQPFINYFIHNCQDVNFM